LISDLAQIAQTLRKFSGHDLTGTLSRIESAARGVSAADCSDFLLASGADKDILATAACLPHILEDGERIEYLSLGAGNIGRAFDFETNYRVAEFKFIRWRGGAESIRQNSIFKDYFLLAEGETDKRKYCTLPAARHQRGDFMPTQFMPDVIVPTPGILGSVLVKDGEEVWGASGRSVVGNLVTFGRSLKRLKLEPGVGHGDAHDGVSAPHLLPSLFMIPTFWKADGYGRLFQRLSTRFTVSPAAANEPGNGALANQCGVDSRIEWLIRGGRL
jgi:hypothetical protein